MPLFEPAAQNPNFDIFYQQWLARQKNTEDLLTVVGDNSGLEGDFESLEDVVAALVAQLPVNFDPVDVNSGTAVSIITDIPSWVRRIVLRVSALSTNGTSSVIAQIGPSSGLVTANYVGSGSFTAGASAGSELHTNGFRIIPDCRKVGTTVVSESDPSDASGDSSSLTNDSLLVTWAASSDPQVTHVRLYRTTGGGSSYLHDQDIAIGTTSVDTTTTDANLGDEVETDHDRPPLGQVVLGPTYNGILFIIKDNLLYFSSAKQPEYWPTTNFIEVSTPQFPLKAGDFMNGQLYCFSKHEIYFIQGTGSSTFFPYPMKAKSGAQNIFGAVSVPGKGIFHTGSDGIYLFSGTDQKITEGNLEPIFRGETINGMAGVKKTGDKPDLSTSWLFVFGNYLYFGYASTGYTYPNNVLVFNLVNNRLTYYVYNDGSQVEIRCLVRDETNNRTLVGDNSGYVREIEKISQTRDDTTEISWEAESKEFTLATRKHFPRWNKYDVDASSATSATGYLRLDGSVHKSHTITGNRNVRRRLVDVNNGSRASIGFSGTGPAVIYGGESE